MCDKSFISFHDFSPRATFLYVSPSVYDILGFKPEEMIGTSTYDYVWPPDWEVGSRLHREIIGFDKVAVLTIVRYRTKSGVYIPLQIISNVAYDCVVCASGKSDGSKASRARVATAEEVQVMSNGGLDVKNWNIRQDYLFSAVLTRFSEAVDAPKEPRVCMILNRFSKGLNILYSSAASETILGIDPNNLLGESFLALVHEDSRKTFSEEIEAVKTNDAMTHLRFWIVSPAYGEIECEAVISCGSDGLVFIIRRYTGIPTMPKKTARPNPAIMGNTLPVPVETNPISGPLLSSTTNTRQDLGTHHGTVVSPANINAVESMGLFIWPKKAASMAPELIDFTIGKRIHRAEPYKKRRKPISPASDSRITHEPSQNADLDIHKDEREINRQKFLEKYADGITEADTFSFSEFSEVLDADSDMTSSPGSVLADSFSTNDNNPSPSVSPSSKTSHLSFPKPSTSRSSSSSSRTSISSLLSPADDPDISNLSTDIETDMEQDEANNNPYYNLNYHSDSGEEADVEL